MALHGSLKELRLGDVLQTILAGEHEGTLRVRRGGDRAVFEVTKAGLRLLEPEVLDEKMIVEGFVARGTVPEGIAARASNEGSPLATLLASGAVSSRDVDDLVRGAAEDRVLEVLAWPEGDFRFEEGAAFDPPKGPVAQAVLDPSGLLLRAAQRLDESRQIAERVGASALLVMPVAKGAGEESHLSDEAKRLASRLDGKTLLDEIALKEGLSLFGARKAAVELIDAGRARLPDPKELNERAKGCEESGDVRAALGCLRQWQGAHPLEPEPYSLAAALCAKANRYEDECDSLKALGRVHLKVAQPKEARAVFEKVLAKRPGDADGLEGLRQSAKALGDEAVFCDATRRLATDALEAGDGTQAAALVGEALALRPQDVEARVLRTRALILLGDKTGAVDEIERIAGVLPDPCRKKADRAAATWCRDAIAQMAPDRSDLLRQLRERSEPPPSTKKRIAILAGLLVVCSVMGLVLWPHPAGGLLAKARSAYEAGDLATATAIIGELAEKYPDTREYEEAMDLKGRIEGVTSRMPKAVDSKAVRELRERIERTVAALPKVPDDLATTEVEALVTAIRAPEALPLRGEVIERLRTTFPEALASLRRSALERRDALDVASAAAQRPPSSVPRFEEIVKRARAALQPGWGPQAAQAAQALRRLGQTVGEGAFGVAASEDLRCIEQDVRLATADTALRAADVDRAWRELHRMRLTAAYEAARIEAASALVSGELEVAEGHYQRLGALVDAIDTDPVLQPLKDLVDRRGILEFSRSKMDMVRTIREGLAAATAAESAGNLAAAGEAYAALVRQFPLVQFDRVFTIPVLVKSTPPGARVALNGKEAGVSPAVVRYGWGSQAVVTVVADGYETGSLVLRTGAKGTPEAEVTVSLMPRIRWIRPVTGVVEAPPLGVDGDAVLCTRSGRVERRARETGEVRWTADTKTVEGVRGRPALSGGVLWVPLVDGRVARISADSGALLSAATLPARTVGDAASIDSKVACATESGLVVFDGEKVPTTISDDMPVTAGVIAAFGAFWAGDAKGRIVRVDAKTLAKKVLDVGATESVVGLAAGEKCVYVATEDGVLASIDGGDGHAVLWKRPGLGDLAGNPAEAVGTVAVADREGILRLFSSRDGSPKGERRAGTPIRGGLVAIHDRIAAALSDGRFWVFAPALSAVTVDVSLNGTGRLPVADLGDGIVLVPSSDSSVTALRVPR